MENAAGIELGWLFWTAREAEEEFLEILKARGAHYKFADQSEITLREMARDAYWAVPEMPVFWLAALLGWDVERFMKAACPSYTDFPCNKCSEPIPVFCENRHDRDRYWGIKLVCQKCDSAENRLHYEDRSRRQRQEASARQEAERRTRIAALKAMPYQRYLGSDHWQEMRKRAIEAQGQHCQICRGDGQLNVHHNTYERRGEESLGDLLVLCADCHQLFHDNGKLARPPVE